MQIGFFGFLTLIFVTLKLTNYIDWSWWLVLLPMYGGFAVVMVLFLLVAIFDRKAKFTIRRK